MNEKIIKEIRKYLETNENKNTTFQNLQILKNLGLPQETRTISNKQPNQPSKRIKKKKKAPSQKKEITKYRGEINKID